MSSHIALVSCSKRKQSYPCTAQEMYSPSTLFSKATSYVRQQHYATWYILSAKYGLLHPNDIIEPYDITLHDFRATEIRRWTSLVGKRLLDMGVSRVDFYAGERYRKYLIPLLESNNIVCDIPLQGMGIGQQLHFYGGDAQR